MLVEYLAYFAEARRSVRERAGDLVASLPASRGVTIVPQSHASFTAGLKLYRARPDKDYSLTDCISMKTMRGEGLTDVHTSAGISSRKASARYFDLKISAAKNGRYR